MTALTWRGVSVHRGGRPLLDRLDLHVPSGGFVVVVGANGAGKTTLLRTALGLLPADGGQVLLGDGDVAHLPPRARAAAVAWMPQHRRLADPVPAVELVAAARFRFDEPRAAARAAARDALALVGGEALADRAADTLSGGEAQRVALAALVAQDAGALLLDEPGTHLDPAVHLELHAFLQAQWGAGRTVLCVTHDLHLLPHLAPGGAGGAVRVVGLAAGRVTFDLPLDAPSLPEALGSLYRVRLRAVDAGGRRHLLVEGR